MALSTQIGIVLRSADYKEYDRMVTVFTEDTGRVDAAARGCRRPKSPLITATQPFAYGEFAFFTNNNRTTINTCEVRETFYPIREDVERYASASYMTLLVNEVIQASEKNSDIFSLLYYSLSYLAYGESDPVDVLIAFIVRFLNFAGYCPSIVSCAKCGADLRNRRIVGLDYEAGGAVCGDCIGCAKETRPIVLEAMRRMLVISDKEICNVKLQQIMQKELMIFLNDYCRKLFSKSFKPYELIKDRLQLNNL